MRSRLPHEARPIRLRQRGFEPLEAAVDAGVDAVGFEHRTSVRLERREPRLDVTEVHRRGLAAELGVVGLEPVVDDHGAGAGEDGDDDEGKPLHDRPV